MSISMNLTSGISQLIELICLVLKEVESVLINSVHQSDTMANKFDFPIGEKKIPNVYPKVDQVDNFPLPVELSKSTLVVLTCTYYLDVDGELIPVDMSECGDVVDMFTTSVVEPELITTPPWVDGDGVEKVE